MAGLSTVGLGLLSLALLGRAQDPLHANSISEDPRLSKLCGMVPAGPLERANPTCQVPVPDRDDFGRRPGDWAPWTHQPYCANSSYCVFTNSLFQQGHGISIITTPRNAASTLHLLESSFNTPFTRPKFENPPYEVKDIPGKGKGVVATRVVRRGEKFMIDYAGLIADVAFPSRVKQMDGQKLLERAVEDLPRRDKVLDLARSREGGTRVVEDLLRTNSFGVKLNDMQIMALFPEISRMNHDCSPNAFTRFSQKTLAMTAVAFRDIEPGEEITISYSEFGLTSTERREALLTRWGFLCTCRLCQSPPEVVEASDARREKIKDVRARVLEHVRKREFKQAIALNEDMLDLIVEENLLAPLGEHYEIQARLYHAVGDWEGAVRWGRMAMEDLELYGGPDVYDQIGGLKDLLERKN